MLKNFSVENLRNMLAVMEAMQKINELLSNNMMSGGIQSTQFNPRDTKEPLCFIEDRITIKDGQVIRHPNGNVVKYIVARIYDNDGEKDKDYSAEQIQSEIDSRS